MQSGLLYVDKPAGITSHDVVARVRRAARTKRVGHAGTLDPFATGLLVVAVGGATRLLQYINGEPKVYVTDIAFGYETDTDDSTGTPSRLAPPPNELAIQNAIAQLTGALNQIPPAYSAKHVDGVRAYKLAREGREVELTPSRVVVHSWEILELTSARLRARITCSGGTYIRALARDLGKLTNSAAHCEALRREASGNAHVNSAYVLETLENGSIADGTVNLSNPLFALRPMKHLRLSEADVAALRNGKLLTCDPDPDPDPDPDLTGYSHVAFLDSADTVLGVGERVEKNGGAYWQPRVVLAPEQSTAAL